MDTPRGRHRLRHTTIGWKFLVQWKGGSKQWIPLKLLLRKRDKIIAAVKSKVRSTTHKYGVEIPTSVAHAQQLDEENKNTFWQDAIKKEMYQVSVAFEILDNGAKPPPG